jgi:hypothetical protein
MPRTTSIKTTLVAELARLRGADRSVHLLVVTALVALALGLFHVAVWAVDGGSWAGPVSWRKPIVFGVSIFATTSVLAWVLAQLPSSRGKWRATIVYTVAMALEYGLIAMQRWRGVASHFNKATVFDGAVFTAMGILIVIASVIIVGWTIAAARSKTLAPDRKAAIVGGMVLLDIGLVVGLTLSTLGGLPPDVIPVAWVGALKPTHAIALHGVQVLPMLWVWLVAHEPDIATRTLRLKIASVAYGVLFVAALLHLAGAAGTLPIALGVAAALGFSLSALAPARVDRLVAEVVR